jgi:hypothetical protein
MIVGQRTHPVWKGDIPMGLDDRLTVHVAVLGPMKLDSSDEGHLGRGLGAIGIP